ncbi:MAG: SRPBCC family protein [Planctomycetes bacterium]|nr:SRPBCC family protein [Planctomycetota bacterium]
MYIGIPIAVLVVALVIFVKTRPKVLHVERSAQVQAPSDVVFSIINDLHQWTLWSPYDKRDPAMKKTFEGPPTGPGASYAWNGNNQVGEGRMTIMASRPGELVTMKLEFTRPFKCLNEVNFILVPTATGTNVTWKMEGPNSLMGKIVSLFINMDKMVGKDFEQGLANLDVVARAKAGKA